MTSNDTVGAFPPPSPITPNFATPESIAYRVIVASVLGPVIAIPICAIRLYTKRYILRNTGYDDCESDYTSTSVHIAHNVIDAIVLATVSID
jgi:hypothetical protein